MWIFSPTGSFVSAVQHRDDENKLMVRARDWDSMVNMVAEIELAGQGGADVEELTEDSVYTEKNSDYCYRIVMSKETFALWLQFTTLNMLTYHNYKGEIGKYKNAKFMNAVHGVWSKMLTIDENDHGTYNYNSPYTPSRGSVGSSFFHDPYDAWDDEFGYDPSDSDLRAIEGLESYPNFEKEGEFDYLKGYFETLEDGSIMWRHYDAEDLGNMALEEDTDGNTYSIMNDAGEWVTVHEHASAQGRGSEDE